MNNAIPHIIVVIWTENYRNYLVSKRGQFGACDIDSMYSYLPGAKVLKTVFTDDIGYGHHTRYVIIEFNQCFVFFLSLLFIGFVSQMCICSFGKHRFEKRPEFMVL